MKPIAKMWLTGGMMDRWYKMQEPDGKQYDWNFSKDAIKLCEENGWECIWVGDDEYKPEYFKNQQLSLGV